LSEKFTSKERDAETGLDWFSTRYFSGAQGRFTSPDTPLADQHAAFPQSWNLYNYVRNNPLRYTDPTGEDCVYTSNQTDSSVTATIERGDCTQKGGTFVNGTIDTNSLKYNGTSLDFGYTDPNGGVGTFSKGLPEAQSPGLLALQRAGQLAGPVADIRGIGMFYGASALGGIALYAGGAFAGAELTTLAGENGVGLVGNQAVNQMISAAQRELLRDMFKTGEIPKDISPQTLRLYKEVAERAIAEGKDGLGVQAERLKIIAKALRIIK